MLTVEDYGWIRRASRDGMSIREMARTFHHSRRKVREVLKEPKPRPYRRAAEREAPVLGPFQGLIDQILADDEAAPRNQRHTAAKVYRRLRAEHGYAGSYAPVQRYVKAKKRGQRETYIPLTHDPGRRLEADFGHHQGPDHPRAPGRAHLRNQAQHRTPCRGRHPSGGTACGRWRRQERALAPTEGRLFNRPVTSPEANEAACLGVALLAGTAAGVYRSLDEAVAATVRPVRTYEPDPKRAAFYASRLPLYRSLYPLTRQLKGTPKR